MYVVVVGFFLGLLFLFSSSSFFVLFWGGGGGNLFRSGIQTQRESGKSPTSQKIALQGNGLLYRGGGGSGQT